MKFRLALLAILALFLVSAKGDPTATLTIVNKSGMSLNVSILAEDLSKNYFFNMPTGTRKAPTVTTITIPRDLYRMRVYWLEERDPTTYLPCRSSKSSQLVAQRKTRIVITECDRRKIPRGEPGIYKFTTASCIY
jgi:hypothetical protein